MSIKLYNTNIGTQILDWYNLNKRILPWRKTQDPYKIWLSEVMLQQTQVKTVIPYYKKWVCAFPTLSSVANANFDHLLKQWEGLGYYSRCKNFHRATIKIINEFGGKIPSNKKIFQSLPGVGEYISGAVMSIAFDKPHGAIDGNNRRVLYRYLGLKQRTPWNENKIKIFLNKLVLCGKPGDINQAFMDIGSTICRPKSVNCDKCPVNVSCKALKMNNPLSYPSPKKSKKIPTKEYVALSIIDDENIFIIKRSEDGLLGGLWELPNILMERKIFDHIYLKKKVHKLYGQNVHLDRKLGNVKHAFTHYKMIITLFGCRIDKKKFYDKRGKWVQLSDLDNYAFSAANHKLFKLLNQ